LDGGLSEHRLVAIAPHGTTIDQWKRFGLVTGKSKVNFKIFLGLSRSMSLWCVIFALGVHENPLEFKKS